MKDACGWGIVAGEFISVLMMVIINSENNPMWLRLILGSISIAVILFVVSKYFLVIEWRE